MFSHSVNRVLIMNTSNLYLENTGSWEQKREKERARTRKSDFAFAFNVREINASSTWD